MLLSPPLTPLTSRLLNKLSRTLHLAERYVRVVHAAEPVKAPEAPVPEGGGQAPALVTGDDTAIALAPAVAGGTPLPGAAVEVADAATGHLNLLAGGPGKPGA